MSNGRIADQPLTGIVSHMAIFHQLTTNATEAFRSDSIRAAQESKEPATCDVEICLMCQE
jgi:hypothetical protein